MKIKVLTEGLEKKEEDLQASKKLIDEREGECQRLREEIENKNTQLVSKDLEMESYKKATEEKIFQLQAKLKELEERGEKPPSPSEIA